MNRQGQRRRKRSKRTHPTKDVTEQDMGKPRSPTARDDTRRPHMRKPHLGPAKAEAGKRGPAGFAAAEGQRRKVQTAAVKAGRAGTPGAPVGWGWAGSRETVQDPWPAPPERHARAHQPEEEEIGVFVQREMKGQIVDQQIADRHDPRTPL